MSTSLALVNVERPISDLERAQVACDQLSATFSKMEAKRDQLTLALQVERVGGALHPDASADLKSRAAVYSDYVRKFPKRAAVDVEDLDVEIEQIKPELAAARARVDTLKEAAADRFAATLIPRHRAAVTSIARALEIFSAALAEEAAIQDEFALTFPEHPRNSRIPHMSAAFTACRLDIRSSSASAWGRAATVLLAKALS